MTLRSLLYRFEPAVPRRVLFVAAALAWGVAGAVLAVRAAGWLLPPDFTTWGWAVAGLVLGWVKSRWMLDRVARHNVERIRALAPHKERVCVFAFQALESWLLVLLMIGAGMLLRLSPLSRPLLGAAYLAIGTGLLLASRIYWRAGLRSTHADRAATDSKSARS